MLLLFALVSLLKHYGTQAAPLPDGLPGLSLPFSILNTPIFARDDSSASDGGHRTILDILWSCLATTFACTWVSVHPNVPFRNEGKWTILGRRIYLMFFSILAPEFMVMWAFKQWRGARMIRETVNEAIKDAYPGTEVHKSKLWTTAHGHFLQMGGFRLSATALENSYNKGSIDAGLRRHENFTTWSEIVMDHLASATRNNIGTLLRMGIAGSLCTAQDDELSTSDVRKIQKNDHISPRVNPITSYNYYRHETSSESWTKTVTIKDAEQIDSDAHVWEGVLHFDALRKLLVEGLIPLPTITEDEINDRSKGDALSKAIALVQLTWFVVQIITRVARGLAISEFELTTAALAGLNSVMYFFWWSKPRDVRCPILIRTKGVEKLLADRMVDDVKWKFSDEQFDFRKHLWVSVQERVRTTRSFILSFPFGDMVNQLSNGVRAVPQRIRVVFASITEFLKSPRRKGLRTTDNTPGGDMLLTKEANVHVLVDRQESPERSGSGIGITAMSPDNKSQHFTDKLKSVAMSGLTYAALPFFLIIDLVDMALLIPITQILGVDEGLSFSDTLNSRFDVQSNCKTFRMILYSEDAEMVLLFFTSSVAGALFGAFHCLAWNFSFPSYVEKIMWRCGSLGVLGSCIATLTAFIVLPILDILPQKLGNILGLTMSPLFLLIPFVYPIARIALLVLAVTSLRSLPPSTLDTIKWVELFPHI